MNPTPIEERIRKEQDREARQVHNAAFDAARARGADFHCATQAGFAATDNPPTEPKLCAVCKKKRVVDVDMCKVPGCKQTCWPTFDGVCFGHGMFPEAIPTKETRP